ncbi:M15 family metallopeptidase [Shouchella patagoniensis]|uniref:M15 family metallopeptidase n=1 Tax=Shouchella patagoniensis TaxID=228576 RepID=UPI0009956F6A|nr:M15 family metallopeptidase [Shouchella patagoniensis]
MSKSTRALICIMLLTTGCSGIDSTTKLPLKENPGVKNNSLIEEDPMYLQAHLFNEIIEVSGQSTIMNPDNFVANVNRDFKLPADYKPEDLVVPNIRFSFDHIDDRRYIREDAANSLEQLFKAAEDNGVILYAVSGFRSYERQEELYEEAQSVQGENQSLVAMPGHSEHQTGLAMDVSSASINYALSQEFGETKEGKWVKDHAHLFGFIIRYPEGKEEVTGYSYEPWHLRYVGDIANDIYVREYTLEEYLEIVKKM